MQDIFLHLNGLKSLEYLHWQSLNTNANDKTFIPSIFHADPVSHYCRTMLKNNKLLIFCYPFKCAIA